MSKKISKPEKLEFRKTIGVLQTKTIDKEAGIYEVWISTEDVDRDGDIVEVAGADLKSYMKNPIVLFGHKYSDPEAVVGEALKLIKKAKKGIIARFQFAEWGISVGADVVRRLWEAGLLKAASIGFRVLDGGWEEILTEDDRGEPRRTGWRFVSWELLEFSIVPVPANQEALRLAFKSMTEEGESTLEGIAKKLGEEFSDFSVEDFVKAITGKEEDPGDPEEGEPTDEDLESVEDDELDIETDEEGAEDESDLNIDEDDELTEEDEAALDEAVANLEEVLDELALSTLPVRSNEDDC